MARESKAVREGREAALRGIAGVDNDHIWRRLEADLEKIGLVHLTTDFLSKSIGKEQSLFVKRWDETKAGNVLLLFDVRRHANSGEYYLHGYEAAMSMLVAARYKYLEVRQLSASKQFLASQGPLPKPRHAAAQLKTMLIEKRKRLGAGYKLRRTPRKKGPSR